MAAALGRLADDEGLRRTMGSAARRNIERFRMDRVLDQWERVFEIVER
jgi:glycosyltransferase involved in cell wall biosynthesis